MHGWQSSDSVTLTVQLVGTCKVAYLQRVHGYYYLSTLWQQIHCTPSIGPKDCMLYKAPLTNNTLRLSSSHSLAFQSLRVMLL